MSEKKIAIITGCEGQLGKVFIKNLIQKKYHVIGIDIKKKSNNKKIEYFQLDISKHYKIENFFKKIKNYKNVDLLINNAAHQIFTNFEKRNYLELDKSISVNLTSVILFTKNCYKFFFKKQNKGNIINIGSIYGVVSPNFSIYSKNDRISSEIYGATKAGVIHLTKYFANYLAEHNIRVNCISPGGVLNKIKQNKKFQKKYSKNVPMKRLGEESEIGNCLNFLIDGDNYINGQNIMADGGLTII
jgi:3-oxoacyl-[acyl-carrier protein] reductase